jgi:outer membrane protein assembly factor BamB
MRISRLLTVALASAFAGGVTFAQVGRGGSEWLTAYGDAQRTSWIPNEPRITVDLMSKPGFDLQWTAKLDSELRGDPGLAQGVTANGVTLFVPMSIVAGSSNTVYALDNDTGYVVWQRQIAAPVASPMAGCAAGITSAATRIVNLMPQAIAPPTPPGGGRGVVGYRSLLGEPGQGVPVEARGGGPGRAGAPVGDPAAAGGRGGRGAAGGQVPAPGGVGAAAQPGTPATGVGPQAGAQRGGGAGGGPAAQAGGARGGRPGGGGGRGPTGPAIPGAQPEVLVGGNARPSGVAYVVSSDGALHVVGLPSGKDIQPPVPFLPANARWSDTIAVGTRLYAATSGLCGGAPNGVFARDLTSGDAPVVSWRTNGGGVVGPVAFTTTGRLIATIGPGQTTTEGGHANAIVALDPETLQIEDWYTQPTAEFVTGPTVFRHHDREIVAAATKDGRVLLLDTASLGGADHATPLHTSRPILGGGASISGSLASWQQAAIASAAVALPGAPVPAGAGVGGAGSAAAVTLGTRWILVPVSGALASGAPTTNGVANIGSVLALRLIDGPGGTVSLESGWRSHDLRSPATPIIVNGVVFALSTGRSPVPVVRGDGAPGGRGSASADRGMPAVLYAYDGASGQALWNSGASMTTAASPGSFWSAMGQAYVGTSDGTVYAFGFLDERR